jgi:hypothetical protein
MGLIEDAGLQSFDKLIGCTLKQTKEQLSKTLEKASTVSTVAFMLRNGAIQAMRRLPSEVVDTWNQRLKRIATIESEVSSFLSPESPDMKDMQNDAMGQLSFNDKYFKCLNIIPYILVSIAIFKIWVVPAFAIATPIFAWVIPYIFLKFMYKLPISQKQYTEILGMVWSGNPLDFKKKMEGNLQAPSLLTPRSIIQTAFMVFSFVQSLAQPLQNAFHLHKTDSTAYSNGLKILELKRLYSEMKEDCRSSFVKILLRSSLEAIPEDPRRAIRILMEEPERFNLCMKDMAELEIMWRIAHCPLLKPAVILETGGPHYKAESLFDLSLGENARGSNVNFSLNRHHAALTGPNGGGKSSFLRAVLQGVLLGQTYGVAAGKNVILRRFGWISSGLRLQDAPGNLSMFETEVWFAANLLKKKDPRGAPGLVLYDELFHSTNPPDGIRTAERFLTKLWENKSILSIVSTHVFSLVEDAPSNVIKLCCKASLADDGEVVYSYNVEPGVCTISSVQSIWKRFGL